MNAIDNRSDFIDYAKAFAIILVIIQHTWGEDGYGNIVFNYIVRMAVPIFVMISGFNFSNSLVKLKSMKEWYSVERVKRKLASWIFPMLAVFLLWTVYQLLRNPDFTALTFIRTLALQECGRGAYYFFIIVELYFMFPFVYCISRKRGGI